MFFWIVFIAAIFVYIKYFTNQTVERYEIHESQFTKPVLDNTRKFRSASPAQPRRITRSMSKSMNQKLYDARDYGSIKTRHRVTTAKL